MAVLQLRMFPDPVLRKKSLPVVRITESERKIAKDMIDTMYVTDGVGLAANQVGIEKRIFVASPNQEKGKELIVINPRIIEKSGKEILSEGCLSLPGIFAKVKRYKKVVLKAQNIDGEDVIIHAEGLLARIFQQEIDHLNGILFIDHLGIVKRHLLLKKLIKPKICHRN